MITKITLFTPKQIEFLESIGVSVKQHGPNNQAVFNKRADDMENQVSKLLDKIKIIQNQLRNLVIEGTDPGAIK